MENKEVDTCKLLYNTERVRLYVPEYGRNVQKMVDYLKTIEDRQKRNEQAWAVVRVMEIINPAVHLQDNYEQKLWDHLHIISGFDLDVDSPYPVPSPEILNLRPEPMSVEKEPIKALHYGRNIENIIDLIASTEEGESKTAMIYSLAEYMRQQYLTWNKDSVTDEIIFQDIERLSGNRIKIPEGLQLNNRDAAHARVVKGQQKGARNGQRQRNNQKNRKQHNK